MATIASANYWLYDRGSILRHPGGSLLTEGVPAGTYDGFMQEGKIVVQAGAIMYYDSALGGIYPYNANTAADDSVMAGDAYNFGLLMNPLRSDDRGQAMRSSALVVGGQIIENLLPYRDISTTNVWLEALKQHVPTLRFIQHSDSRLTDVAGSTW